MKQYHVVIRTIVEADSWLDAHKKGYQKICWNEDFDIDDMKVVEICETEGVVAESRYGRG